jgi:DNA-binding Xre family transcriptional regulator
MEGGEDMGEKRKNVYSGSISYKRLWDTMERRGITKADLKKEGFNLSPTLVNRLVRGENVAVDTIMYLCDKLDCQPCDILEYKKSI